MHSSTLLAGLGFMLSAAVASPVVVSPLATAPSAQNVVYWGQNGGGTIENNDLSAYCTSTSGIDVIVLAFLYSYGSNGIIPSGTIGQSCYISTSGQGQNCDNVASSIATCQAAGIKMILSLGGASGSYSLTSNAEAQQIGQYLWESYGNSGNTTVQRPFGNNFVNGFDFDIETNQGSQYYPAMISTLRAAFATDSAHTYYITGAPQCPIPEPNMGVIISGAQFDYLFVQWYNNNNYSADPCSLGFNNNAPLNYNQWVSTIASTPSANAKIFFGVPAAPLAANGAPSGELYYITPDQLSTLVNEYKTDAHFGGIMMWSAGFSDTNVINGCTYAQQAHAILLTGSPCSTGPISATTTPTSTGTATSKPTSTPTTTTAVPTGTPLPQWAQCGGNGYTGSTACISPYTCVTTSVWWSQCE
ncbi:Endochitinase [Lachnellula suecica]|uniref:chitinase n=1 Tax=Lachnellula suecica TaxID=602035 RepID=A0A8T9CIM4_9HELO|nr:Endochitinase [Lachnellula suecica]